MLDKSIDLEKKDVELKVTILFNMVGKRCIHIIQIRYILKSEMSEIIHVTTNIMQACRMLETAEQIQFSH